MRNRRASEIYLCIDARVDLKDNLVGLMPASTCVVMWEKHLGKGELMRNRHASEEQAGLFPTSLSDYAVNS